MANDGSSNGSGGSAPGGNRPVRVFFVDDDPQVTEMMRDVIDMIGYELVGVAVNGKEAVEMYGQLLPDITIMDCKMPVMDGITATSEIRARHADAKILMLSGHFVDQDAATAAGVIKILHKPVGIAELKAEIDAALGRN